MLKLTNITKDYTMGSEVVHALQGVSLEFRKNEFVSVLGPSGCGKTTMLNIIGGLDRYTDGDLILDNKSTKNFKDGEWDAYRNNIVGMVFQTYNLIPHLSVLENVSIALTLSGVSMAERKERSRQALISVGLESQINKKPNQLSGGQMQRVAIARALVNNPDIILADEPTGALDTKTSIQVMEILKNISKEKLVIMVTHNEELAKTYSDRIVKLLDGKIVEDNKEYKNIETKEIGRLTNKKTSMSFITAVRHSFENLKTKKGRTILTSIAGSIGILGIALVLALSNGMSQYIETLQSDTLAGFPLSIMPMTSSEASGRSFDLSELQKENPDEFPEESKVYSYTRNIDTNAHTNYISSEYVDYLSNMDSSLYNSISYSYGLEMHMVTKTDAGGYKKVSARSTGRSSSSTFSEMPNNTELIASQYDILASLTGKLPQNENEAALVVDSYNRVSSNLLNELGINIEEDYDFEALLGREFKVISNNNYYSKNENGAFTEQTNYEDMYNNTSSIGVKIVAIIRVKESASAEMLSSGIIYTNALTKKMLSSAEASEVVAAQLEAGESLNVLSGEAFNTLVTYENVMLAIGADSRPTAVQIYPVDFDAKDEIKSYLDKYNEDKEKEERILYTDLAEDISNMTSTLIDTVTISLSAFAGISLIVSSIMIGIITYVSVVERTKEIGILRAIGARKKDISRLFNAETLIIGFSAGVIGIVVALILSIPLNSIIEDFAGITGIVELSVWAGVGLIILSMILTLIAGFLPSRWAAKKDPVLALRSE